MPNVFYDNAKKDLWNGTINLASDPLHIALIGSGYVPNQDTDQFWSTVQPYEVSGAGYAAGGQPMSGQTVTIDTTNHRAVFKADNVVWPNTAVKPVGAVIYKDTGTPSTSPILFYIELPQSIPSVSVNWDATNGIAFF
ncbi:MAG: hypothetical protein KGL39_24870 [Patescibacteria group bacterium]|nr:hypothetical protein [Patescibacteria group bacterium]